VEIEGSYRVLPALTIAAHVSHNDARYRDFNTLIDGAAIQLAGHSLVMSPKVLAGAGVVYAPQHGWRGSVTGSYAGRRYLDAQNAVAASGYLVADASLGYAFDRYRIELIGSNLGDRRDPVLPRRTGGGPVLPPARSASHAGVDDVAALMWACR